MVARARNSASHNGKHPRKAPASDTEPHSALLEHLNQWVEYTSYYFQTQTDLVRLKARKVLLQVVLAAIVAAVALAVLIAVVGMLFRGLAGAATELLGGRIWAGDLATAAATVSILIAILFIVQRRRTIGERNQLAAKYAQLREKQRHDFGEDVEGRHRRTEERRAK